MVLEGVINRLRHGITRVTAIHQVSLRWAGYRTPALGCAWSVVPAAGDLEAPRIVLNRSRTLLVSCCFLCAGPGCSDDQQAQSSGGGAAGSGSDATGAGGSVECSPGQVLCPDGCVTLAADPTNCGQCGLVCPAGAGCVNGSCVCPADTGLCDNACLDLSQDAANCGGCGIQCAAGQLCELGQCVCQPGLSSCAGTCVDLQSDGNNCGQCGVVCPAGQVCSEGGCTTDCLLVGQTACGASCVDLSSDPLNCGSCGTMCAAGRVCSEGNCVCPAGLADCAGQCVDLTADVLNCGQCGVACAAGQSCLAGVCQAESGGTGGAGAGIGGSGTGGDLASGGTGTGGDLGSGGTGTGGDLGSGGTGTGGDLGSGGTGTGGAVTDAGCEELITNPSINWRESSLQTDQEIVECLATSLGRPVGYGENAFGGYDPAGGSTLTVITKSSGPSVEQQIADAVSGDGYNWIVFDKVDFASPSEIALYRLHCDDADVQAALGISSAANCIDYQAWCAANDVSGASCLETFFNDRLNDGDLPIRNVRIGSNTTIDGRQSQAYFVFSGFAIGSDSDGEPVDTATSVILTNLLFQGAGHTEDHDLDPDMIRSTGASHDIWIHQNTFDLTGDSAFDVKVGAYDVTMSFNLVKDVLRATLHGSSDSRTINEQITTTIHHNAFITTDAYYDAFGNTGRRVPLLRRGRSHLFNNVFYGYRKDILSVRVGARIAFEDNMFLANPAIIGDDDIDYYLTTLLRDFREGGLEISGSHVWMSDASCNLDPSASGDLTASYGSTPDMFSDYSAASQSTINANRFSAGEDLADYVLATAGKGGATPFNSPYTEGQAAIMSLPHSACQQ